jgi:hypothetical protein
MLDQITNQLNQEITLIHTPTSFWLLKKSADAFALYSFYCYTASWQGMTSIKASGGFVQKALGWGKDKFSKAQKILVDAGIIKENVKRDTSGRIIGHYLLVRYSNTLSTGTENHHVDETTMWVEPPCGFQETNTGEEILNTSEESLNTVVFEKNDLADKTSLLKNSVVCLDQPSLLPPDDNNLKIENAQISESPTEAYNKFLLKFNEIFKSKHRVNSEMVKKLQTRLKNYSLEEIFTALDRLGEWDFAHGNNDRKWKATPEFLLRSDTQVDRFLNETKKEDQEHFVEPDKQLSAEIRVMAGLMTGIWDSGINFIYSQELIPWMREKNKKADFENTVKYLIKFTQNRDNPQVVNDLSWIMVLQTYEKYLRTCRDYQLQPRKEIFELGEQVKNEHRID